MSRLIKLYKTGEKHKFAMHVEKKKKKTELRGFLRTAGSKPNTPLLQKATNCH